MHELKDILIEHEGLRLFPYRCTAGKLTIGIGRNIEDRGINTEEALLMLKNDIESCKSSLISFDWFNRLNIVRQDVLIELAFNIGIAGVLKFKRMIKALEAANYMIAAEELLKSKWATQVSAARSKNMAFRLSSGTYKS